MLVKYSKLGVKATTTVDTDTQYFEGPYYRLDHTFYGNQNLYSFAFNLKGEGTVTRDANYFSVFEGCSSLQAFISDLSHVRVASRMFKRCTRLSDFQATNGLDKLYYAEEMFSGCTSLTIFDEELPILVKGDGMFSRCKLNKASVLKIVNSLKGQTDTYGGADNDGVITLGINSSLKTDQDILNALGISSAVRSATFTAKNGRKWKVKIEWN